MRLGAGDAASQTDSGGAPHLDLKKKGEDWPPQMGCWSDQSSRPVESVGRSPWGSFLLGWW